jgi:hypothetical protein
MLLILGNVAKMLPVVRERLLLDVNSRTAHLVSKQFSIRFTIWLRIALRESRILNRTLGSMPYKNS